MGQRLVIRVKKEKKVQYGLYFHWSAYTSTSLAEMERCLPIIQEESLGLNLIKRFSEETEIFLSDSELPYFVNRFGIRNIGLIEIGRGDRNSGLLVLNPVQISEIMEVSDGDIQIDLDNGTFAYNVLWENENYETSQHPPGYDDIPYDLANPIQLSEFNLFKQSINSMLTYTARDICGRYFNLIE